MRNVFCCVILLVTVCFLGGCGFKDIDKRFFVVATGIDKTDNEQKPYRITLQLALPSPKIEPGASKAQLETIDASSIAEGVRMLKSHVDKELDFGHCKIFLVGEELARSDYSGMLQWMRRRRDIQSVADIAVAKPDAQALLGVKPVSERYPGNTLFLSFGADGTDSPYTYVQPLSEFSKRAFEKGLDPLLPIIIPDSKESYIINRTALLNKNKIIMVLSPEETQLFAQLAESYPKSSVRGTYEDTQVVAAVSDIRSKYRMTTQGAKTVIAFKVKMSVVLEDAPENLYKQEWASIEKKLSEDYSRQAEELLRKIQQAGVDPFGFGLRYRANHHSNNPNEAYEKWLPIYPGADFKVNAKVNIEGTGLIQ
ncbi:Ger(x)C family spore germination protein [Paenibacillus harenae]|uniref:Ger(x)C family spore germination protein n=1 Tax=Paenibacillus harenae TaxID=306543 RepID=UPI0027941907|nr:Ger(x)C family spore germination protein [Paenibacillus harenae]MDQ0061214.1 Ger(x)C family germination protein [Paenibacillus harenae]